MNDLAGRGYPPDLSNDGFAVTEEEANIMARFCRNWVRVQRSLPEESRTKSLFTGEKGSTGIKLEDLEVKIAKYGLRKEDIQNMVARGNPPTELITLIMHSEGEEPWPAKVRDDFVEKIENFAGWAEQFMAVLRFTNENLHRGRIRGNDSQQLKTIVNDLAKFFSCNSPQIAPKGARKELLISSILEAQEERGGS